MVLESCMILLDNSEYMRNGDYVPTRLEAQHDAANLLVGAKTQSNPESTVGVIAMTGSAVTSSSAGGGGGGGAELLISPTDDMGKILSSLHGIPIRNGGGSSSTAATGRGGKKAKTSSSSSSAATGSAVPKDGTDITGAIQVASLALKHRRNKNGSQRVVAFVGSPLSCDTKSMTRTGRQLKKNNVAIDVICLGEAEINEPLLQELVDAANGTTTGSGGASGETTCHLVTIPPGVLPSDVLVTSPIVHPGGVPAHHAPAASGGGGGSGGGGDAFAEYGGVDPNMDPELAMALRVSMEEERARQERAAAAAAAAAAESSEGEAKEGEAKSAGDGKEEAPTDMAVDTPSSEDAAAAAASSGPPPVTSEEEDALLQQALAMSMVEDSAAPPAKVEAGEEENKKQTAEVANEEEDEDAAMQLALQMSMQPDGGEAAAAEKKDEGEKKEGGGQFQDPQFVNQLLGSLPGVDPNDPAIQDALRNLQGNEEGKKKDGDDATDGEKKE